MKSDQASRFLFCSETFFSNRTDGRTDSLVHDLYMCASNRIFNSWVEVLQFSIYFYPSTVKTSVARISSGEETVRRTYQELVIFKAFPWHLMTVVYCPLQD